MRHAPLGYVNSPVWLAFELFAEANGIGEALEDWEPWWFCFLVGFEVGLAEAP